MKRLLRLRSRWLVSTLFPWGSRVSLEQVREATGFELLVREDLDHPPPVYDDELRLLRHLVNGGGDTG